MAWSILNQPGHSNARQHVQAILNSVGQHSLGEAATWADCLRDVQKSAAGFKVVYASGKTPQICRDAFPDTNAAETQAMIAYAQNNWSQCDYTKPGGGQCDLTYHFDDIPYQHGRYTPADLSTSPHDAVSAVGEAAYYLKNGHDSPGAVVVFSNPREALFVLAHLVGDLHQPLHVGAVYLDAQGQVVDPSDAVRAKQTSTRGGNVIFDAASRAHPPPELHGEWDKIAASLGTAASPALVADAQARVAADAGPFGAWPALWASESVALARDTAFAGLTYAPGAGPAKWTFQAPAGYAKRRATAQKLQLERAGVRLALLLEAIWPG